MGFSRAASLLFVFALLLPERAAVAKKSLEEYWRETGLKFSLLEPELTSENCYSDERSFLACVYSINAVLAIQKDPVTLVSKSRYAAEAGFGAITATIGPVHVAMPKRIESEIPFEIFENMKKERGLANVSWSDLYQHKRSEPVSFEALIAWLKSSGALRDNESAATAAAMNMLLSVLKDPHTMYLPAPYVEAQASPGSDEFTGIGVYLRSIREGGRKLLLIEQPVAGGPALKAGLRANDVLLKIDGKSVEGMSIEEASPLIQGAEGSSVQLTVRRKGREVSVTVTRERIVIPNVASAVVPSLSGELGYLKLHSFIKDGGCTQLKEAVRNLEKRGVKGFLFDLRENPGGLLIESICVANLFLKKGDRVVSTETLGTLGGTQEYQTTDPRVTALPLVTLINARSASASELVAGALQDYQRAVLVGERTFGKGTVQSQTPMEGGKLVLRRTVGKFFLPSGRSNQVEGVYPDLTFYRVPNPTAEDRFAMREEDEYMALPPMGPKWTQPRGEEVSRIERCVSTQGSAQAEFARGSEAAIPSDYQLLAAQDTLGCMIKEGLGVASERDPQSHWGMRPFRFSWGLQPPDILDILSRRLGGR